jgi:hypothetical protein
MPVPAAGRERWRYHEREEAGREGKSEIRRPKSEGRPKPESRRLLEPVAELSYGDAESENLPIQGNNVDALKALLPYYAERVECTAINPPYRLS